MQYLLYLGMPLEQESRIPQSGEALILADGRRFTIADAEAGVRGWWFRARSLDGRSTLQGNTPLRWDAQAHAWRPAGVRSAPSQPPVSQRTPQLRQKQLD